MKLAVYGAASRQGEAWSTGHCVTTGVVREERNSSGVPVTGTVTSVVSRSAPRVASTVSVRIPAIGNW